MFERLKRGLTINQANGISVFILSGIVNVVKIWRWSNRFNMLAVSFLDRPQAGENILPIVQSSVSQCDFTDRSRSKLASFEMWNLLSIESFHRWYSYSSECANDQSGYLISDVCLALVNNQRCPGGLERDLLRVRLCFVSSDHRVYRNRKSFYLLVRHTRREAFPLRGKTDEERARNNQRSRTLESLLGFSSGLMSSACFSGSSHSARVETANKSNLSACRCILISNCPSAATSNLSSVIRQTLPLYVHPFFFQFSLHALHDYTTLDRMAKSPLLSCIVLPSVYLVFLGSLPVGERVLLTRITEHWCILIGNAHVSWRYSLRKLVVQMNFSFDVFSHLDIDFKERRITVEVDVFFLLCQRRVSSFYS